MSSKKRFIISFMVFILVMSLFVFTAGIEFTRSYQNHVKDAQDQLMLIKINLENLITSRMVAIYGLKAYVEINPNFSQKDFNYFAHDIYESSNDVVQNMAFLTDTTITHIFPYAEYKSVIGNDLSMNIEQMAWVNYAKENQKSIITAPVNLIEGGVGIIVRVPVVRENEYFGQVSIVFDYEKTLASSGINALAENYFVELKKMDELIKLEKTIWSNFESNDMNKDAFVFTKVNLYGTSISLFAIPKSGFNGKSNLFYLILTIGWLIATISCFIVYKLLTINAAMRQSEIKLIHNNDKLEDMVLQLKVNEEQLFKQYDEINTQKEQIKFLADCDYLTNLYNRRRFTEDITKFVLNNKKGTILLFDVDNFKNINDTQGHHYGDKVLKHIGVVLRDVLSDEAIVYRIGGDEFAIHLPEIIEPEKIEACIKSFFSTLKGNNYIDQIKNHITSSVGIAKYPNDSSSADDLLMKCDIAMYQAKKDGKNRFCYYTKKLNSNFDYSIRVEKELQNALEQNKFNLVYQPIINSLSGEVESLEALIRISDSLFSPAEFIPMAESTGLIISIGHWVIDQVCLQLSEWEKKHLSIKPVAINISAKQLYDDSIIEYIQKSLGRYSLSPEFLEIEITESVLIENSEGTINLLRALRDLGIKISLDDFGTGYSSLSYLTYMPVDKVKIDKSLKDKFLFLDNSVVMDGVISICHGLKMKVVTEGVESKEEYERLRDYGSDLVQGYYFEKPISADEISERLTKNYIYNSH